MFTLVARPVRAWIETFAVAIGTVKTLVARPVRAWIETPQRQQRKMLQ